MALGTNPSFSQVKAFFEGSSNFTDYVRGGVYVPNIPANAAISTTAVGLALTQFSGADKVSLPPAPHLENWDQYDNVQSVVYAMARVVMTLRTSGDLFVAADNYGTYSAFTWLPSGRSASEYQCRYSIDGSSMSPWQTINVNRDVLTISASTDGFYSEYQEVTVVLEIGSGGTTLATCTLTGQAGAEGRG